jgi:hypothetical protein
MRNGTSGKSGIHPDTSPTQNCGLFSAIFLLNENGIGISQGSRTTGANRQDRLAGVRVGKTKFV